MQKPRSVQFSLLLWALLSLGLVGCSILPSPPKLTEPRLVLDVDWIKPTVRSDYKGPQTLNPMSPILTEDMVILGNAISGIGAFSRANGQRKWWIDIDGGITGGATAINDHLFFGGADGRFYAVKINEGLVDWSIPLGAEVLSAPLLHEGRLYFLSGTNTVFALDAVDGSQLWVYPRQDPSGFSIRGGSTPLVHQGVVYIGFSDGYVAALDEKTGTSLWERQLNGNKKFRDIDSSPLIEDGKLFLAGYDDAFYALDPKSGQTIWSYPKGGYGAISSDEKQIFYATTDQSILALEKSSGKKVWEYRFKDGISPGPRLNNNLVVASLSSGPVVFLDKEKGRKLAEFAPGLGSFSRPAVDDSRNQLYFISRGAILYSMNFQWKSQPPVFPKLHGGQKYSTKKDW